MRLALQQRGRTANSFGMCLELVKLPSRGHPALQEIGKALEGSFLLVFWQSRVQQVAADSAALSRTRCPTAICTEGVDPSDGALLLLCLLVGKCGIFPARHGCAHPLPLPPPPPPFPLLLPLPLPLPFPPLPLPFPFFLATTSSSFGVAFALTVRPSSSSRDSHEFSLKRKRPELTILHYC